MKTSRDDDEFAGVTREDAETLRSLLPAGRDFLSLSELDAAKLLSLRGEERVKRNAIYHRARAEQKVVKVVDDFLIKFDAMGEEEREAVLKVLRGAAG